MYAPRGFSLSEASDVEVVPKCNRLHLFNLRLPNPDVDQHAVAGTALLSPCASPPDSRDGL
ncbi:MAG TPA: hypothetical protein VNL16_05795 [Chloroflexota bacterium]|nr:hypothetical protein [Chloroflexota bacterium]